MMLVVQGFKNLLDHARLAGKGDSRGASFPEYTPIIQD
jgi:hypothetical protein